MFISTQFKLLTLSVSQAVEEEVNLNLFLRQNRVLTVHREFVQDQHNSHWSLLVEYLSGVGTSLQTQRKICGRLSEHGLVKHLEPMLGFTQIAASKGFRENVINRFGVFVLRL